jgi:hypothetical protein
LLKIVFVGRKFLRIIESERSLKMKRIHLVIIIATVLTVSLLLGARENPKKWEYARLSYGSIGKWHWDEPGVSAKGVDVKGLCNKLSIETPSYEKNIDVYVVADWAGSKGWELIVVTRYQEYSVGWFKRPK